MTRPIKHHHQRKNRAAENLHIFVSWLIITAGAIAFVYLVAVNYFL